MSSKLRRSDVFSAPHEKIDLVPEEQNHSYTLLNSIRSSSLREARYQHNRVLRAALFEVVSHSIMPGRSNVSSVSLFSALQGPSLLVLYAPRSTVRDGLHPECDSGAEVGSTVRKEHSASSAWLVTCCLVWHLWGVCL